LAHDSSVYAGVFKAPSGSRVVIKSGLHRSDPKLNSISHPCISTFSVIDDPERTTLSVQQPFLAKGSLGSVLSSVFSGTSPYFLAKPLIMRELLGIAFGLDYLHSNGLVYGCLSPSNLLFDDNYHLSLDLSSCCYLHNVRHCRYSAPESFFSQAFTRFMDIYSFGVLAYELLTGSPLLSVTLLLSELRDQICYGVVPSIPPTINPIIGELVRRCLSIDPTDRPSIEYVIDELLKVGPTHSLPPTYSPIILFANLRWNWT
jgi:serine/threonine protein kinase